MSEVLLYGISSPLQAATYMSRWNKYKGFEGFHLEAKARIGPSLSHVCPVCLICGTGWGSQDGREV